MHAIQTAIALFITVGLSLGCVGEVGPQGPTGPEGMAGSTGATGAVGTNGSPDTSAQVLAKLNSAVQAGGQVVLGSVSYSSPQYNIAWGLASSVALAKCLSASGTAIFPTSNGLPCSAVCTSNTGGSYPTCVEQIRVFSIAVNKPKSYTEPLGRAFVYPCTTGTSAPGDPVDPQTGPDDVRVCCCR